MASRHIRDLGAISTRIRVSRDRAEIACVLREAHTYINVPKAVATYLSVRPGSWRCDMRRESYWAARGVPNGARPRADPLWGRSRPGCRKAKIVSARPGAVWDPTGGSGHFLALKISKGARAYGQIGGYGLMTHLGISSSTSPARAIFSMDLGRPLLTTESSSAGAARAAPATCV